MVSEKTTITLKKETKGKLDSIKICKEESYNSLLERVLPKWAQILKTKLEETEVSPTQNEENRSN